MEEIQVVLVDELDNEVGTLEKMEAHRKALLHRAVSVFVMNKKGEWLMQRRALHKYHSAGLWTNTCCTHPYPGESYQDAAQRRLKEEMGMNCSLRQAFSFVYKAELENGLTEHELDHIFIGVTDELPLINEEEVCAYEYVKYRHLVDDVALCPDKYTAWFKKVFKEVHAHIGI